MITSIKLSQFFQNVVLSLTIDDERSSNWKSSKAVANISASQTMKALSNCKELPFVPTKPQYDIHGEQTTKIRSKVCRCPLCNRPCSSSIQLREHVEEDHGICSEKLIIARAKSPSPRQNTCTPCGQQVEDIDDMSKHAAKDCMIEPSKPIFLCSKCGSIYKSKFYLDEHMDCVHNNKRYGHISSIQSSVIQLDESECVSECHIDHVNLITDQRNLKIMILHWKAITVARINSLYRATSAKFAGICFPRIRI